jgi:sucrose phosphorylase
VQYTLHVCDEIFAFWRQSMQRDQSIFCLHNVSNKRVPIPLSSLNLIASDSWTDLVSGHQYDELDSIIEFAPYQFVWLSNKILD